MLSYTVNIACLIGSFLGFALFLSGIKRIPLYTVPLLVFSGIAVFLFPFTLFGAGKIGVMIVSALNLCALSLWLLRLAKPAFLPALERRPLKDTASFLIVFFALCGILTLLSQRWYYTNWDEFDNYNMVVNSLLKYGKKLPIVTHAEYPYGVGLVEYYLCSAGGFNEHIMLFSSGLIFFSAILFGCSFAKRPLLRALIFMPVSVLLVYVLGYSFYGFPTVMLDCVIAAVFSALIGLSLNFPQHPKRWDWARYIILCAFFIQIKDVCAAFTLVAFALLLVRRFSALPTEKRFKHLAELSAVFLLSCLPYLIWFLYLKINGITRSHELGNVTLANMRWLFVGDNMYRSGLKLFMEHTFTQTLGTSGISIFGLFLILFGIIHLRGFFSKNHEATIYHAVLLAGALAYTLYVGLVYIFVLDGTFDEYERFILSYLLGWMIPVLHNCFDAMDSNSHAPEWIYARCCAFIALIFILIQAPYQDILHIKEQDPDWIQAKSFYEEFSNAFPKEENARIFSLTQGIMSQTMLRSLFVGEQTILSNYRFDLDKSGFSDKDLSEYLSAREPDYLYVYRPDEAFWENFASLFGEIPENIETYHLFIKHSELWYPVEFN